MSVTTNIRREATAPFLRNNVAIVQLLALCPLLAVTTSLVNGVALGLASAAVIIASSTLVSTLRTALVPSARLPLTLLILAALVTSVDLIAEAYFYDIHDALGLFVPLIVVNSGVLGHAQNVASRRSVAFTLVSAVATALGFLFTLMTLGALREIVGHGTLFAGIELLGGESSRSLMLDLPFDGMLVAVLPPGAFFGMAALLALRNRLVRNKPTATTTDSEHPR